MTSVGGLTPGGRVNYEGNLSVTKKALDQQKADGQAAVKLIEGAEQVQQSSGHTAAPVGQPGHLLDRTA